MSPQPYDKHQLWITEKLAKERAEREGRERMWELVTDQLAHLDKADILLAVNPLDLGPMGNSYLEQVQIVLPEVGPGYGQAMWNAVLMLTSLLRCRTRDMMTDEERVQVGWMDDPYVFECRACKRRLTSPCNDREGFQVAGPWDSHCRDVLYPEEVP